MPDGLVGKALGRLQEATGQTIVPAERLEVLEAYYDDYRVLSRQLDNIGWGVLNYLGGQPNEMSPQSRLNTVQRARVIWANDPQGGASVELMNDFVFGRGMSRPRAKDKKVQEKIDEFWDDPDNQEVLTTIEGQLALGTDLALQSNVFLLVFGLDDDTQGTLKLSILRHDDVTGYVPHPEKRHRVLYYMAREVKQEWDFQLDAPKPIDMSQQQLKPTYYEHWRNVELTAEEADEEDGTDTDWKAPEERTGDGRVYHLRINRSSEQVFGVPRFQRTMTWYSAYNKFVKDRLDIVAAAASLIMKRKIKGTPAQLMRDASKLMSRDSPLAVHVDEPGAAMLGPRRAGAILDENESVDHEAFNLDTRAGNAQQDAQIIRAPISAAERFSQAYFGDASNSNLATATSLELPILKAVESRQEVFERLVRFCVDRVIEKAVDDGELEPELTPEELPTPVVDPGEPRADDYRTPMDRLAASLRETVEQERALEREVLEVARVRPVRVHGVKPVREVLLIVSRDKGENYHYSLLEGYEDQEQDEQSTERDLSYEFSMPSPLRRMMTDLITSITTIAQTFDPNNTNPRLSRTLLTIALGEGLEVQDAPDLVDEIFPKGYVDPLIKAQMDAATQPQPEQVSPNGDTAFPTDGSDGNPYGAPMNSTRPEDMRSGPYNAQEAAVTGYTTGRDGSVVVWTRRRQLDEGIPEIAEPVRAQIQGDTRDASEMFQKDVIDTAIKAIDTETLMPTVSENGDH